jgi:cyclopropane-fatty-acyl-phospholipid synthase
VASKEKVGEIYDYIDELWRCAFGENADCSNALYGGDSSKSLEQAQKEKHAFVLNGIKFAPGARVLDIGCGWGAMLRAVEEAGGHAVGLTVSAKQAEACRRSGLQANVLDWRDPAVAALGRFDGILCMGALEHFCSVEEYLAGQQDRVYDRFFRLCHELLARHGRLYLQSVLWGERVPRYEAISVRASKGSDEYIIAAFEKLFVDSCLPFSREQLERVAGPYFTLDSHRNGRLDYIITIEEWRRRVWEPRAAKLWIYCKMARRALMDRDFWYELESARRAYWAECFRRHLMDHERMVFEKRG